MRASKGPTVVVVGAGAMGRIVVTDLVETAPDGVTIVVCDVDRGRLRGLSRPRTTGRSRIGMRTMIVDARDVRGCARLFRSLGAFGVINAASHHVNLAVMEAALAARAHYCDLGGLFHVTRKQIVRHRDWKTADRLALLGIGAAPGIVNVLARSAADTMDDVCEIHVSVASRDRPASSPDAPLAVSYSIHTVIEEATQDAAVFTGGRMTFVPPMSDATAIDFPDPVGRKWPARTIHSEVATLPRSYTSKGLRECSFRIAFPASVVDRLTLLRSLGLLSDRPVAVNGKTVAPRDVVLATLRRPAHAPSASDMPVQDEYEVLRVVVRGSRRGDLIEETVDCHTPGKADWGIGSDINTGSPASIAMQMLASGEITARGCLPPERCVPTQPFFAALERRGMFIRRAITSWSSHASRSTLPPTRP
jgi:saccharopine dehydrogenase (NAD+, L-lysine-forming)